MSHMKYKVIGVTSYDDDTIADLLSQITGYEVFSFNQAFNEDTENTPACNMIIHNINEHKEASYIRSLNGVMINAPCDGKKTLNPDSEDFILPITSDMKDIQIYRALTKLHEDFLVEHTE